jgi:hypothetical protein
MSMERLPFKHRPRNSIANNLDKINELVDWTNLDTHLYASASGERVTVDDASSLKGLTVDGRSVQDGTPTPDAPVPVQVVEGANAWHESVREVGVPYTNVGITWTKNADGTYTANGRATANAWTYAGTVQTIADMAIPLNPGIYTASTNAQRCALRKVSDGELSTLSNVFSSFTFTAEEGDSFFICPQVPSGVEVTNETYYVQIVPGSVAVPYTPYGYIGIVVGDTATAIDLQGNKLASLPDRTRDELHVDSAGHVWIEKRVGHTTQAVTDGVTGTIGTDVLSSTGRIADGADVWYKLAAPQTIDLGYIAPPAIPSGSVVSISASLTPTIHLEWWVDDGITELVDDLIAYIDYKTEG